MKEIRKKDKIYEYIDWASFIIKVRDLANIIKNSKYMPDIILGISRGGLIPATMLSYMLKVKKLSSVQVIHYDDNENELQLKITEKLSIDSANILVVDDIVDSGKTLKLVKEKLKSKNVKTAVIYYKIWSTITPDFYARKTTNWIIFPWEIEGKIS